MEASNLYNTIKSFFNVKETVLCKLYKSCENNYQCKKSQQHLVVNFDEVKTLWDKGKSPRKSCDAIAVCDNNKYLHFIEHKGWIEFLKRNSGKQDIDDRIKQQASSYDFLKKLV